MSSLDHRPLVGSANTEGNLLVSPRDQRGRVVGLSVSISVRSSVRPAVPGSALAQFLLSSPGSAGGF